MKVAYVIPINISKYAGVLNKVDSQVRTWIDEGLEVKIYLITAERGNDINNTPLRSLYEEGCVEVDQIKSVGPFNVDLIKDYLGFNSGFKRVQHKIREFNPDLIYTRNTFYQPFFKNLSDTYKFVFEANSDFDAEYYLQSRESLKYFLRYIYYRLTKNKYLSILNGVVAVTEEIEKNYSNISAITCPNGIKVDNYSCLNSSAKEKKILFLGSSGMKWHGVDTIMELAEILPDVNFDLVGIGPSEFNSVPKNVVCHGFLDKNEYMGLFKQATAMVSSLAFYRNGMEEACPLKVREYVACCKPVILAYKDTAFEINGYPEWVLQLENNKESILQSGDKIREFLDRCKSFSITQEEVKEYVDTSVIEKRRIAFFKEMCNDVE